MEKEEVSLKNLRLCIYSAYFLFTESKIYLVQNIFSRELRGKTAKEYYGEKKLSFWKGQCFTL